MINGSEREWTATCDAPKCTTEHHGSCVELKSDFFEVLSYAGWARHVSGLTYCQEHANVVIHLKDVEAELERLEDLAKWLRKILGCEETAP